MSLDNRSGPAFHDGLREAMEMGVRDETTLAILRENARAEQRVLNEAESAAEHLRNALMLVRSVHTYPEMGYGYITNDQRSGIERRIAQALAMLEAGPAEKRVAEIFDETIDAHRLRVDELVGMMDGNDPRRFAEQIAIMQDDIEDLRERLAVEAR